LQAPFELNVGFRYSRRIVERENAFDFVVVGIPVMSFKL
jgi:hypothetical protein